MNVEFWFQDAKALVMDSGGGCTALNVLDATKPHT